MPPGAVVGAAVAPEESKLLTDLHERDAAPDQHPLDSVENFALANAWNCDRVNENELSLAIDGRWCVYRLWFGWESELDALLMSCAFDMKVPENRVPAVHALLAFVNERLWVGHFDVFTEEAVPTFRHAMLLGGTGHPTDEQLVDLFDITISECERFYPAFQYVIWGGKSAAEAVQAAIIDPIGEA